MGSPTIQKYIIVEVLEDYNVHTGTKVGHLAKVNGSHRSLYQRCLDEGDNLCLCIPPMDLERFSHQIPFFEIAGGRFGGFIELDPASLPLNSEGLPAGLGHEIDETYLIMGLLDLKISWQQTEFRHDTVWAIYDKCTRMPQKYVAIQYFYKPNPESRIKISLLKPCHVTEDERKWSNASFPISCGNFIVDETLDTDCHLVYSHPVLFELQPKPCEYGLHVYKIYPQKGDIWGIYENLDVGGSGNLSGSWRKLQYEIVEVVQEHNSGKGTEARKLVRVEGFQCLFKRERSIFTIPRNEHYRFSHQIPAYKFGAEHADGHLKGAILLDPILVPKTEQDYFTFRDFSVLETLKLKPLHVVLQYLTGEGKSIIENKELKCQQPEHLCLELEHLKKLHNLYRKEGMEGGGAVMENEQLQCRKLEEDKRKIEEPILRHFSRAYSMENIPKSSLNKQVKPKTAWKDGQPVNLRSSTHSKGELMSNHNNHFRNAERKEVMEGGRAARRYEQLKCRKPEESKKAIETEQVKPKACQQGQLVNLGSSDHLKGELMSDYNNVNHGQKGNPRRTNRPQHLVNRVSASEKDMLQAKNKAEKVQSELDPGLPSFVKLMLQSHVGSGFWLGLPASFCKLHLPEHDCTFSLMNENGKEFEVVYLARKTGLSGGWRGFSIAHQLVAGDALVFQLIQSAKFKVHIIRGKRSNTSDRILILQNGRL